MWCGLSNEKHIAYIYIKIHIHGYTNDGRQLKVLRLLTLLLNWDLVMDLLSYMIFSYNTEHSSRDEDNTIVHGPEGGKTLRSVSAGDFFVSWSPAL